MRNMTTGELLLLGSALTFDLFDGAPDATLNALLFFASQRFHFSNVVCGRSSAQQRIPAGENS